jgi:hypothetical protein
MVSRRRYLAALSGCLGTTTLAGCGGVVPLGDRGGSDPTYPGGTLVVDNTGSSAVAVSITVVEDAHDATLDRTVDANESVVRREFVTAEAGAVVTLAARLGDDGSRTEFRFLPGGGADAPPEVAHLTVQNAVEASASWTATEGR